MKRPLAWIGFSASAALLLAGIGGVPIAVALLIAGGIGGVVLLCIRRRWPLYSLLAVCISVALAAGVFLVTELIAFRPLERFQGQTMPLTLQLTDKAADYSGSALYTATVAEGEIPAGTRVRVWVADTAEAGLYDLVTGVVTFYPPEENEYLLQNKADGVLLTGYVDGWDNAITVTASGPSWQKRVWSVRQSAVDVVEGYLSGDAAAIVRSICLGDRQTLSADVEADFRESGTSHLLVVSGLHLSMIASAVLGLLRFLRVRRRPAAVVAMIAVVLFMCLVGFTPSVRRAGTMLLVMLAGQLFKREADGLNSLGLALLLMGLADPYMVFDVGLQLSAGSVAGILLLYSRAERTFLQPRLRDSDRRPARVLYKPAQAVVISLSATALIWPLLGWYFGEISLVFLPANLLMVFPATLAVITGLLGVLTGGWFPLLGKLCFFLSGILAGYLQGVAEWLSTFPLSTVYVRYGYVAVWAVLCILLFALLRKRMTTARRLTAGLCAVIVLMASTVTYHTAMRSVTTCWVTRSDKGMAALMEWDDGDLLVVSGEDIDLIWRAAAELEERRIDRLSAVVFPDLDDAALASMPMLTEACAIERVVCPETGRYAPAVKELFADDRRTMAEDVTFTIGEDHRFTLRAGWLYAATGETVWLFAAANNTAPPPEEWRADGILYAATAPDADWTDASLGVSGNTPQTDAPWLVLPSGERVELFTREDGTVYCE